MLCELWWNDSARWTHNERPSVVFTVLVLEEDVDDGGHEGIQEGKDRNGDEELCRGRIVSDEEHTLPPNALTHRRFKGHLVQPDTHREAQGSAQNGVYSFILSMSEF